MEFEGQPQMIFAFNAFSWRTLQFKYEAPRPASIIIHPIKSPRNGIMVIK